MEQSSADTDRAMEGAGDEMVALAEAMYRERRLRGAMLSALADLFDEPGWDMMLALFVAQRRGQTVSVSSACLAACVSHSTALRYLGMLEERDLVVRRRDEDDGRRIHVAFTDVGMRLMCGFLRRAGEERLG